MQTQLLKTLAQHIGHILSFRHDGRGLPTQRTPLFNLLCALTVFVGVVRLSVVGDEPLAFMLIGALIVWLLVFALVPRPLAAMIFLANISLDLIAIALMPLGYDTLGATFMTRALELWLLLAIVVASVRYTRARKTSATGN